MGSVTIGALAGPGGQFVSGNVTKLDLTVKGLSAYDLASTLKRVSMQSSTLPSGELWARL